MVALSVLLALVGCGSSVSWELLKGDCRPTGEEVWYDGVDQDCDGNDDDQDGDGISVDEDCWDDPNDGTFLADAVGAGLTLTADQVFPGAEEIWYDGVDQDCDGASDFDQDGDGFESANDEQADGSVGDDCVDGGVSDEVFEDSCSGELITVDPEDAASVNPDAEDAFYDGVDQNCDGADDNDGDGDGWAVCEECDDTDAEVFPSDAIEIWYDCADQNCDGNDGDRDGDGYVDAEYTASCADWATINPGRPDNDCDDDDTTVNPAAEEGVGDGKDQNCDGLESCYDDDDDDGYRDDVGSVIASVDLDCTDSGEATASDPTGDCDDKNGAINPDATEIVGDEVDQNCDNKETCYLDDDNDGYRPDSGATKASTDTDCQDTDEATSSDPTGDCNDSDATIYSGATEVIGDGIDQSCDGKETCYVDADNDGYRPDSTSTVVSSDADCVDSGEALSTDPTGDCADNNATRFPFNTEIVGDGKDSDCDLQEICYIDADNDGFILDSGTIVSTDTDCVDPGEGSSTDGTGDCDDTNTSVNPGGDDACFDGLDDDCDDIVDEGGASPCYSAGDLVITEIMFEGDAATDPAGEWFEVYNDTHDTIYMESMKISRNNPSTGASGGNYDFYVGTDIHIDAGQYAVFCFSTTTLGLYSTSSPSNKCDYFYGSDNGFSSPWGATFTSSFVLTQNSSSTIIITAQGSEYPSVALDSVNYNGSPTSTGGWPGGNPGYSYELSSSTLSAAGNDIGSYWCETTGSAYYTASGNSDYGTPNSPNTCP